jgi:hypothetical protein
MTPTLTLFVALTLTLATLLVLWARSVLYVARHASPFPRRALVPLLTPVHTWRLGGRGLAIATTVAAFLYGIIWISAAVR